MLEFILGLIGVVIGLFILVRIISGLIDEHEWRKEVLSSAGKGRRIGAGPTSYSSSGGPSGAAR